MKVISPVSIDTAGELLDFGGGALSDSLAKEQLEGAVAIHNILAKEGFAYLADEVGMGKTYVALGVVALLRFFNPGIRILYIAPRENIQSKWVKELRNFTRNNWLHADQRVKSFHGTPAVKIAFCQNLADWARQSVRDPDRDFFVRLTSFSFPLPADRQKWHAKREELESVAPMIDRSFLDLHSKERFKESYARAVNTLLPHYDLVVVDEAHNLKHGLESHASRNQLLTLLLGRDPLPEGGGWPHYGRRFDRVLLLSATPLETDYREIWNQLDLFGFGKRVMELRSQDLDDAAKAETVRRFMVRRLTGLVIGGEVHTKNMYRREWRGGGCVAHDAPLEVPDARQRLIVALVQKKVAEVLNNPRFNASFQIGMLASFESFLQTAKVKSPDEEESVFDQTDQTDDALEKEGIDTNAVNRLADSYRREFGQPLPHPKMDAIVESLAQTFQNGEKTLVFVRRVKSVSELREKLCRKYDEWLAAYLKQNLSEPLNREVEAAWQVYEKERIESAREQEASDTQAVAEAVPDGDELLAGVLTDDQGGTDTFFSWFFRGEGPQGIISGAAFKKNRLQGEGSAYSTFFEDNYVASLLGNESDMLEKLAEGLNRPQEEVSEDLRGAAYHAYYTSTRQKKFPRLRVFHAYQQAALSLLSGSRGAHAKDAQVILRERYGGRVPLRASHVPDNFPRPEEPVNERTFFTELRRYSLLRDELWPEKGGGSGTDSFRAREQRRELLAAVARLGHAFIDLWILFIKRIGTLSLRAQERADDQRSDSLITDYLGLLEAQRVAAETGGRRFNAYRELTEVGRHYDLIFAVNFPEASGEPLTSLARLFGRILSAQTPVGGMFGGVNATMVRQFRMPGYPLILVTTDVLQEGEDLHTFCSRIVHYGISWTPSAMEQRTGRVDRIGSLTYRRLDNLPTRAHPDELLQVYYPYLADTVEVLQVERVFERMNRFVRMIHHTTSDEQLDSKLDTRAEFARTRAKVEQITTRLESAFPIKEDHLTGVRKLSDQTFTLLNGTLDHLHVLATQLEKKVRIKWEEQSDRATLYGTVFVSNGHLLRADDMRQPGAGGVRQQPFALLLRPSGAGGPVLLHGISPVGEITLSEWRVEELLNMGAEIKGAKLCEVPSGEADSYTLTAEGDILFDPQLTQAEEVLDLLSRVATAADLAERRHLERDAAFDQFRRDLQQEAYGGVAD
jgi:superfamily II DNA or RNA helicase